MTEKKWHERPQLPRRWRKFEYPPRYVVDFPVDDTSHDGPRYLESPCDQIIVYDSCNGFSLWSFGDPPPPAERWIALPARPKRGR